MGEGVGRRHNSRTRRVREEVRGRGGKRGEEGGRGGVE